MSKLFLEKLTSLWGEPVTLTFLFVYCFLFVNYFKILLQLCQLYSTGHFIAELTLHQMLKSGKDSLASPTRRRCSGRSVKEGSTELIVNGRIKN